MQLSNFLDFYALASIDAKLAVDGEVEFHHAKNKLYQDVKCEFDRLSRVMAQALHDYIFLTSFGECRHAFEYIRHTLDALPTPIDRVESYKVAKNYDPRKCYPYITELLKEDGWRSPYGGMPWANVASSLDYVYINKLPYTAFVDYCADLKHNGGPIFNKPVIFSDDYESDTLVYILDTKRNSDDFCKTICDCQDMRVYSSSFITWKTTSLMQRYMALYYQEYPYIHGRKKSIDYTPITFGDKCVTIIDSRNKRHCYSCSKVIYPCDRRSYDDEYYCENCYDELGL